MLGSLQQNYGTRNTHHWPGLTQPATDIEGSGRGIAKDGTNRAVV